MCRIEMITMSIHAIDRLKTVQAVVDGDYPGLPPIPKA